MPSHAVRAEMAATGFRGVQRDVYDRVARSRYYRENLAGLTAHERHARLLSELSRGALPVQRHRAICMSHAPTIPAWPAMPNAAAAAVFVSVRQCLY